MKFKENMKRFWSLSRSNGGFTLVELIVVIAILAILGGVAIPAYGAYVTRANRGVDESLAGEIEHAMLLAYYDGVLEPGAAVVVYYGDAGDATLNVVVDHDKDGIAHGADKAMEAAFGANYGTMRLKWDGWKTELGVVADSEKMGYVQDSSFNNAEGGLNNMLGQVQHVVTAAGTYLEGTTLDDEKILEYVGKTDIVLGDGNTVTKDNASAVANVAVFSVANTISGSYKNDADFFAGYMNGEVSDDAISNQAGKYAMVLGLATYLDQQNAAAGKTSTYVNDLKLDDATLESNPQAILDQMDTVLGNMMTNDAANVGAYWGDGSASTQGYKDSMAFLAYMQGVDGAAGTMLENYDINNPNYFGDGTMEGYVQNYVDAGDILSQINVRDGAFVFIFDGSKVVSVPGDY